MFKWIDHIIIISPGIMYSLLGEKIPTRALKDMMGASILVGGVCLLYQMANSLVETKRGVMGKKDLPKVLADSVTRHPQLLGDSPNARRHSELNSSDSSWVNKEAAQMP
jgi:hypothetical protein